MLSVYVPQGASLERVEVGEGKPVPESAIWFDLVTPTLTEDKLLERHLGIAVPTREEMQEIEVTSRLYVENGARYMTATLMCQSDTQTPKTTPTTAEKTNAIRIDDAEICVFHWANVLIAAAPPLPTTAPTKPPRRQSTTASMRN